MTDTDARLIERLRERHTIVPDIPNDPLAMHINPDGPEAADRIESLTAEVAKLREAAPKPHSLTWMLSELRTVEGVCELDENPIVVKQGSRVRAVMNKLAALGDSK